MTPNEDDEFEQRLMTLDAAIGALRSRIVVADSALVRATQMRVRLRAAELREQRQRKWVVSLACLLVGLSAAITTVLFWRAFGWMGVSNWVFQAGYMVFWIVPVLVVSSFLVVHEVDVTNGGETQWL